MIRRPPRSTLSSSSAASDVYKRQDSINGSSDPPTQIVVREGNADNPDGHLPSRYSKWFKSVGYRPRSRYSAQNCQSPKAACVIPNDPCGRIGLLQSYNLRHNYWEKGRREPERRGYRASHHHVSLARLIHSPQCCLASASTSTSGQKAKYRDDQRMSALSGHLSLYE